MSTSDEDAGFFEWSPLVSEKKVRRDHRSTANTLLSSHGDFTDVEEGVEDEEMEYEVSGSTEKTNGTAAAHTESNLEHEDDGRRAKTSIADKNCNHPGTTPDLQRKRLSIRNDTVTRGRRSSSSSVTSSSSFAESVVCAPSEVLTVYETCSQLFTANRINPQNAFEMKMLDCINQTINIPEYDKSDLILNAKTVAVGTKIYACRVENTNCQVKSLASDLAQLHKKKPMEQAGRGREREESIQTRDEAGAGDDENVDGSREKQQRKAIKKRGRFVEEDKKKLSGLEDQNAKFITRRNLLKEKFNYMISEDLEFEYLNYLLEPEDEHPLQTKKEMDALEKPLQIPDPYIDSTNMARLEFLPFSYLPNFDAKTHDVWGRSLNAADEVRHHFTNGDSQLPANDDFSYDPTTRPAEYVDEGHGNNLIYKTHVGDDGQDNLNEDDGLPAVTHDSIRTLDHLDEYFKKAKNVMKAIKPSKYGWCGPNFVHPKPACPTRKQGKKVKKSLEPIDFTKIDWTANVNDYKISRASRTTIDEKVIASWSNKKSTIPFLGVELTLDGDFDPYDFVTVNDPEHVLKIFK